jgi:hypothetical protein
MSEEKLSKNEKEYCSRCVHWNSEKRKCIDYYELCYEIGFPYGFKELE